MFNWTKKYAGRRTNWELRRGEEALALIEDGGKSKEELMEIMDLAEESVERILKTVRPKIWLEQFGKNRIYKRRPE